MMAGVGGVAEDMSDCASADGCGVQNAVLGGQCASAGVDLG